MKKGKGKQDPLVSELDLETGLSRCQHLVNTSNEMGQIMTTFSSLMARFVRELPKDTEIHNKFDELFRMIVPRLQWHKDAAKNQRKLAFMDEMALVYAHCENARGYFDCNKLLVRHMVRTMTRKNYMQFIETTYKYFKRGVHTVAIKNKFFGDYEELADEILDRYNTQHLPKHGRLQLEAMLGKSKCLEKAGKYHASNQLLQKLLEDDKHEGYVIDALGSMVINYNHLEQWKKSVKVCEKMFRKFKSGFENDKEKHFNYCLALYFHASALKKQGDDKGQEALEKFLSYMNENSLAKQLMNEDRHQLQYFYQLAIDQLMSSPDILQKATSLMNMKKYEEAAHVLHAILNAKSNMDLDTSWPFFQKYLESLCCLNDHDVSGSIDHFLHKNYLVHTPSIKTKFLELRAQCFLHQQLWEEALDVLLKVWRTSTFTDSKWTEVLIDLLIYKKKFMTALKVMEKDGEHRHEIKFRLVHYFMRDYNQAFGGVFYGGTMTFFTAHLDLLSLNGNGHMMWINPTVMQAKNFSHFLIINYMRRIGQHNKANDYVNDCARYGMRPLDSVMVLSDWELALERKPEIVTLFEEAMDQKDILERITFQSTCMLNRKDPKKLLKLIKKELKKPNGSTILKQHKEELQHYISSMKISFLIRKKLNRDIDAFVFLCSDLMQNLINSSYSGYPHMDPIHFCESC